MDGWMDTHCRFALRQGAWSRYPPPPAGQGTVLPTRIRLTPPGRTAHRAPRTATSPVCTNPACSTNQQAGGKQGAVDHPLPQGEQPTRGDTKACGVFVHQSPQASEPLTQVSATPSVINAMTKNSPPMATSHKTKVKKLSISSNRGTLPNSEAEDQSSSPSGGAGWRTSCQGPCRTGSSSCRDEAASSRSPSTQVEAPTRPKPTPCVLSRASQHLASGVTSSQKPAQFWRVCIQPAVSCGHQGQPLPWIWWSEGASTSNKWWI